MLKIGELAKRTGVTIRALRHYDEIGLLTPSARSTGRYRLYDQDDVGKLYRIQALARLNLSLADIQRVLGAGTASLPLVVERQIAFLNDQIAHAAVLRDQLAVLRGRLRQADALAMDDWLGVLARMSAASGYFSDDELQALAARRAPVQQACDEEKAVLTDELRELMARGVTADSEPARELAYRWIQLLMREVGGDEGLLMKYYAMQWNEDALQTLSGIDRERMTYLSHAMAYRRLAIYAGYCTEEEGEHLRRHYVRHTTSWPPLIAAIREHMQSGTDPSHPDMRRLAMEWDALSASKVGGERELAAKLQRAFAAEPALRFGSGIDRPLLDYLAKAPRAPHAAPVDKLAGVSP